MITRIKWKNHPILKSLEINLTKTDGTPYNTIVLAGENGTGKTTILDTLSTFLNLGSIEYFEEISYLINAENYKITPKVGNENSGFHIRTKLSTNEVSNINTNAINSPNEIERDNLDLRHYGCSYSKARSGFQTRAIKTTTTEQLDTEKREVDKNDDFTNIKQLLVDLSAQDDSGFVEYAKSRGGIGDFNAFEPSSKLYKFKSAFNNFYEDLKYNKIDDTDKDEKKILFSKHGNSIAIDQLSTGEKQIVFRGASLLKNSRNISGGIVMIDEPELSMHPKWQDKILDFYRGLYNDGTDQTTQIFIATHSEYVIKSALKDMGNILVIILNQNGGNIMSSIINSPMILPTITAAETNYRAFDIASTDYHTQLYGYLQDKEHLRSVKACDDFIMQHTEFDTNLHNKPSSHNTTTYTSLPTYIRNAIHHPDSGNIYTDVELKTSITLLEKMCR